MAETHGAHYLNGVVVRRQSFIKRPQWGPCYLIAHSKSDCILLHTGRFNYVANADTVRESINCPVQVDGSATYEYRTLTCHIFTSHIPHIHLTTPLLQHHSCLAPAVLHRGGNTNRLVQRNKISGCSALSMFYIHFDIRSLLLQEHKSVKKTSTIQRLNGNSVASKYHVWPSSKFQIWQRNRIVINATNGAWVYYGNLLSISSSLSVSLTCRFNPRYWST